MRKLWPLRWKIALYAAGLGIVSTLAGACTTWIMMRHYELAAVDGRLAKDANKLFRELEKFRPDGVDNEKFIPLSLGTRLIELRGPHNELVYLSPSLGRSSLNDGVLQNHTRIIAGRSMRIGIFQRQGFTASIAADLSDINRIGRDIILGMFGAIPTVLVVVVVGGCLVAGRALAPVQAIRQAAERITTHDFNHRLPVPAAADEIAALVTVFNTTLDRLQSSFEQSVRFSAEASHQLKTPIAVLRAGVEEILTDSSASALQQKRASELLHQIHQLTSIAENLLLLARADAGRLELQPIEFDLFEVLEGICDDARALAEPNDLTVETKMAPPLPVRGDRAAIALIMQNLVENAVKYNEPGGCICIQALPLNGAVEVVVKNNGEPIPPERAPHIFERFYRARPDGRTPAPGLGLSIAAELTKAHRGSLELVRSDVEWTEFRVRLPRA